MRHPPAVSGVLPGRDRMDRKQPEAPPEGREGPEMSLDETSETQLLEDCSPWNRWSSMMDHPAAQRDTTVPKPHSEAIRSLIKEFSP